MKILFIVLTAIAIVFGGIQMYSMSSLFKTEKQKYTVVKRVKDFEIRYYPPALMATVKMKASNYKELANPGFRKLAGFIFGGNENNQQIAMTSPVHMDIGTQESAMSFVMPGQFSKESLPKPQNGDIEIHTSDAEYVAVIRFGGFANDKRIKSYTEKLENALAKEGITPVGNYRFLGYNPPFQLFGRRNEIVVSVPKPVE